MCWGLFVELRKSNRPMDQACGRLNCAADRTAVVGCWKDRCLMVSCDATVVNSHMGVVFECSRQNTLRPPGRECQTADLSRSMCRRTAATAGRQKQVRPFLNSRVGSSASAELARLLWPWRDSQFIRAPPSASCVHRLSAPALALIEIDERRDAEQVEL